MSSEFGGIPVNAAQPQAAPDSGIGALLMTLGKVPDSGDPSAIPMELPTTSGHKDEKYLSTLSPGIAAYVKAVSDGRAQFPSGFIMKTPFGQNLVQAIGRYDPTFDAANASSRVAMRKAATSGQLGQNIASLNTVMGHLKNLHDSVDALHNTNNPWFNAQVADPLSAQDPGTVMGTVGGMLGVNDTGYQTALKNFQSSRLAASKELTRAFRGASGSESDVQGYEKLFGQDDSPTALKAAIKSQIGLLHSRLQAAADQYNRGMGTTATPMQLLTPANAKIMAELGAQDASGQQAAPAQAAGSNPDIDSLLKKYGAQ